MKKIIVKIATAVIVLGLVGGIIYWKSLPEEDVSIETVYTEEYQNDVADELESKKSLNDYDEDHMLIEYNPFKTNTDQLVSSRHTK
jgi:arylsulfate sulfotransferase